MAPDVFRRRGWIWRFLRRDAPVRWHEPAGWTGSGRLFLPRRPEQPRAVFHGVLPGVRGGWGQETPRPFAPGSAVV